MNRIQYGIGYEDLGAPDELEPLAELGDLIDFIDPLGLRNVPGKIKDKVDGYIEQKSQRAAQVASARVEQGVRKAMNDASSSAMAFAAGGLAVGAVVGGVWFYKHTQAKKGGAR